MAADAPERIGRIARIGATLFAPRRLARRDLDAQDSKAGDDLMLLAGVALLLDGATAFARALRALFAGRINTALHGLADVIHPALPLFAAWAVTTLILWLFTRREQRRAPGELGARVTSALVLVSLLVAPVVGLLDAGPLRYSLEMLPWGAAAVVFGLVLREGLDDGLGSRPLGAAQRGAGAALIVAIAAGGVFLACSAFMTIAGELQISSVGAVAPKIDQPLLDGGRLQLGALHGRPVVLSFWATWCLPCLDELPRLERAYRARGPQAALLYAINVDEPGPNREATVRATAKRLGLSFPIVLDDGAAAHAWSVATIPTLARVGADGRTAQVLDHSLDEAGLRDVLR